MENGKIKAIIWTKQTNKNPFFQMGKKEVFI